MKSLSKLNRNFVRQKFFASLCLLMGFAIIFTGHPNVVAAESKVEIEGTVESVRPISDQQLELGVDSGTNHFILRVDDDDLGHSPTLFSRIRASVSIDTNGLPSQERLSISHLNQIQLLSGQMVLFARSADSLRRMGAAAQHLSCVVHLSGQVLAASPGGAAFVLQDKTGITLLTMKTSGRSVEPGQEIVLEGNCVVEGDHVVLCDPPVVSNDDIHGMTERSGTVFLSAGKHPLRLEWFNHDLPYGLEVYYQGPDLPRQKIPDAALFRRGPDQVNGVHMWVNGLDYGCYEGGYWLRVPDFNRLVATRQGTTFNFDLGVISRTNDVGLLFTGYVEVPRDGIYTFSTISDDGSQLYLDTRPPSIQVTGTNALPQPVPITVRQSLPSDEDYRWSQAEGIITFAAERAGGLELELSSDTDRMSVMVADSSGGSPQLLLKSRVRITGICLATHTSDGQSVAGTLLAPGMNQIELLAPSAERLFEHSTIPAAGNSREQSTALPVLTTVEQIKHLTREEWQRGYPVKIRGIITTVLDNGFFIQDATRSIYARWWPPTDYATPRVGDFWEIEGTTFAEFAPNIQVSKTTSLGTGTLPEPLQPAWDQLINGSLDTEYVEVRGIFSVAGSGEATLQTSSGKLILQLPDLQPQQLPHYENALVRVRGCVMPVRDVLDRQFVPGQIRLCNATITVEEPSPADPFATRVKHASDLLVFDARAGALERVKIAGQVVHQSNGQLFLMDGKNGLRVIPKSMGDLRAGDVIEVVGFPNLDGPSPVLHEAVTRQTGHDKLPDPTFLPPNAPLDRRLDSTLVRVHAQLDAISRNQSEQVLELKSGTRGFIARLKVSDGLLPAILPGSRLELTGVYTGQGSDLASGQQINSFELLLNSPSDVEVLARPSWWTVRHTLAVLGSMTLVILVGLVWIALLRRQVEERSNQLAAEIRRHEHTERQRELETERTRIARDLHDDLGATLTQIRFLSAVESRDSQLPEATRNRLGQVTEKSREMVASLDEIVWAVNPANDSLPSVANYLCHFAQEFFQPTPIRCRLDVDDGLPPVPLTSEVRHNLYLAVREALNNIAKHSKATEVWLRIHFLPPGKLNLVIEDNGRGFTPLTATPSGDGLINMRERLQKIGGNFEYETRPGSGVICRLTLPVDLGPRAA